MSDLVILHDTPDSKYGSRPEDRSLAERIRLGVAIVDKPTGPTSHQVSAWVRDMFGVPKAGHSGTLDPRVTGVLPVALADATRAVEAVLAGDKEYVGVLQLHQDVDARRVRAMMARFVGEIYQIPPVRSAVKREQRARMVSEFEPLEIDGRDVLFRVRCESGTYIRTLAVDVGDALGVGANLAVPGVAKLSPNIRRGDPVGVFTGKDEAVAFSKALMTTEEIVIAKSGAAADTGRVLMAAGTYPKLWK